MASALAPTTNNTTGLTPDSGTLKINYGDGLTIDSSGTAANKLRVDVSALRTLL